MTLIQTVLERKTEEGTITIVALLPAHQHIERGSIISLDDEGIRWKVVDIYEDTTPGRQDHANFHMDWMQWEYVD